jgi:hypothetical protein
MPATVTDRLSGLTTSVAIKAPCKVATTANITLYGEQTVNSVAVVEGDRVLVKDQTNGWENGIYVVSTGTWSRAKDFDGNRDVVQGTIVLVRPAAPGTLFYEVQTANPIIIGTSVITFAATDAGVESLISSLADTSSASLGAAMIGRGGQVVDSITALRALLKTSPSKYAFVTGYYAAGDGGGGAYYYDAADTTSADNGGTIIVASDGGRWKLLTATGRVYAAQFGAKFDNATDDRAAIVAAMTWLNGQGGGILDLPEGTALIGSSFTVPENVTMRGRGKNVSILKRNFSGVLITQMGKRAGLEHLQLDGNAGAAVIVTLTGGINFDYQWMQHCRIWNSSASCVTFAHETGAEFRAIACDFYTSGTPGVVACVATLSAGENLAVPRHFISCAGAGSTLFDFSGANDTFVFGGYSDGFITSATTSKLMMSNMRVATTYSPQTIAGVNLCIRDCVFALSPTLTCEDSIFECITPGWVVTDNGSGNSVLQRLVPYTPSWTASTANPSIGNGSITGYYSRQGSDITVQIDLRFGTTTTFGTGNWRISVPRQDLTPYTIVQVVGSGFTQGSGAADFVVIPRISSGNSYIELFAVNSAGALIQLGSATQAWNTAGNIRLSFTYRTN